MAAAACSLIAAPARADEKVKVRFGTHDHFVRLVIESKLKLAAHSSIDANKRTVTIALAGAGVVDFPRHFPPVKGVSRIRLNSKSKTRAEAVIFFDHPVALREPAIFPPEHGFAYRLLIDFPDAAPSPPATQQLAATLAPPPLAPPPFTPHRPFGIFSSPIGFLAADTGQADLEGRIRQELGTGQGLLRMKLTTADGQPESILLVPVEDEWLGPARFVFLLSSADGHLLGTYFEWSGGPQSGRTAADVLKYLQTQAAAAGFRTDNAIAPPIDAEGFYVADRLKDPSGRSVVLVFKPDVPDEPGPGLVRAFLTPAAS